MADDSFSDLETALDASRFASFLPVGRAWDSEIRFLWRHLGLHCTAGSSRSFTAIRKDAGLYCGSRLRKGEVFAYVGRIHNLKDLKVDTRESRSETLIGNRKSRRDRV